MIVKVSSKTNPKKLAYAVVNLRKEGKKDIHLQAIGAGAVNQMVKSIIALKSILAVQGKELKTKFHYADVNIDGKDVTAIEADLDF